MVPFIVILLAATMQDVGPSDATTPADLRALFADTTHDFGSVAKGASIEHVFQSRNTTHETIEIAGVKSSCECAGVTLSTKTVHPGETAHIAARLDTKSYSGRRSVTITVSIDRPRRQEILLRFSAYIRSDFEITPAGFFFGTVDGGSKVVREATVIVRRPNCRITGVSADSRYFECRVKSIDSPLGTRKYTIIVRAKETAPLGVFRIPVELHLSDRRVRRLVVLAEGRITGPISTSEHILLGAVPPGGRHKANLVIRGRRPFRVLSVSCSDKRFTFECPDQGDLKRVHVVRVTFTALDASPKGTFEQEVTVVAESGDGKHVCRSLVSGVVRVE